MVDMSDVRKCGFIGGIWNPKTKDCSLYRVTVADVQYMAEDRFARILSIDELRTVRKGIESGLGEGLDIILDASIDEARKQK